MLRTILIGTCVFVQGTYVRAFADGRIEVKVGKKRYAGRPVTARA